MIEWFNKSNKKMLATIYSTNITINKPGLEKIDGAYAARVGLDKDSSQLVIKPMSKDEYEKYGKDENLFVFSGGTTYTRISSTDLISFISEFLKINFKIAPKKYECTYNSSKDYLVVDFTKEVV